MGTKLKTVLLAAAAAAAWSGAGPALAQAEDQRAIVTGAVPAPPDDVWGRELLSLRASLAAAERRIADLERQVKETRDTLAVLDQGMENAALLAGLRGGAAPASMVLAQAASTPDGPVGEAPPDATNAVVAALPENTGVLTRPGRFVFEPALNYTNAASNRLVFRGVEIVTGVQIGVIEADTVARDTLVATGTLRYGLTSRSEVELRVPYLRRNDRITTIAQRDQQFARTMHLDADGLGDVELTGRYQLTGGGYERPIVVANVRVKSNTGSSPYEVARDEAGVAQELALGSGFWAVEPSLSALIVTDPAVIFANLSWLHSFPKSIDKVVGDTLVGRVEPGDSIGASLGFGFSLNPRFSFSLGYRHNYIFRTATELGGEFQKSESLQVGSLMFGMSYRATEARTINTQFEFGVTSDAPSMSVTLRTPFSY